jgi:hypothetical protein
MARAERLIRQAYDALYALYVDRDRALAAADLSDVA